MSGRAGWEGACVWCGAELRGEGRNMTTDHGGPYHLGCLPPFPREVLDRVAAIIAGGTAPG